MDETGRSLPRTYLWEQKALSPSVRARRSECHYMVGGRKKKKDIWHWNELHACNSSSADRKWLQFVIWTFQRWKRGRPPERTWAGLLFRSRSSASTRLLIQISGGLLTCNILRGGTEWADRSGSTVGGFHIKKDVSNKGNAPWNPVNCFYWDVYFPWWHGHSAGGQLMAQLCRINVF